MGDFQTHEHVMADGRKLQCWLNRPTVESSLHAVAVLVPGFGRRMHQHSVLSRYLTANGIGVVRFDSLDHIGMSDGSICDFTLSTGLASLDGALAVARRAFPGAACSLIATSLTARLALRCFAQDQSLAQLIAMSGIVHVRRTLAHVLNVDYSTWAETDLPETEIFESQTIRMVPWHQDGHACDWFSIDGTQQEVAGLSRPVHWFVGRDDDWIEPEDITACAAASPDQFILTWLESCGHDIGRNASATREMMRRIVALCAGDRLPGGYVAEPSYNDLLQIALRERRIQRAGAAVRAGAAEVAS